MEAINKEASLLEKLLNYRDELVVNRDVLALKLEILQIRDALKNFETNGNISTEESTGNSA